ncbi:neo-calmodulin-like [Clavelina lepadiformis]|uniref:neo-calmodulin-like n=1 Tax=Clavelina lepadiformis TaxID=159417 RepID=UPI0040415309
MQKQPNMERRSTFADLHEIFNYFDVNRTKTIDLGNLRVALPALGFNLEDEELEELIDLLEVQNDTTLNFREFVMVVEHLKDLKGDEEELRDAFKFLQEKGKEGYVNCDDLKKLLTSDDVNMDEEEVVQLIRVADALDTGFIKYDEFIQTIMGNRDTTSTASADRSGPSSAP